MKQKNEAKLNAEHGSAGAKFLIVAVILFLIGHGLYNYVPVAYQGQDFKQDMQVAVTQGVTMPKSHGKPTDVVRKKLKRAININGLPIDTYVDVKENKNVLRARVYYTVEVPILPFGIYNHNYVYDHTATPGGFLTE